MNPGPRVLFLGRRGLFPRSLPLSLLLPSPHILASCLRVHEELWAMGNHDGVVLLRNMPKAVYVKIDEPKAVYVKIDDTAELFLKAAPVTAATDGFPACRPRPAWSARAHPASPPLAAAAAGPGAPTISVSACDRRAACGHTACNRPTCHRPTCEREGRIRTMFMMCLQRRHCYQ